MNASAVRPWLRVVAVLAVANVAVATLGIPRFLFDSPTFADRVLVWVGMSLGPLSGWLVASLDRQLPDALSGLLFPSSLCAVAFASAVVEPSVVSRFVFAVTWFASGYLFTIAIWV